MDSTILRHQDSAAIWRQGEWTIEPLAAGARPRQIRTFIISEALLILVGGVVFGTLAGWLVAQLLVTVLQGVFDPPPETLSVPWLYLAAVAVAILVATAAATLNAVRQSFVEPLQRLRELQ